MEPTGFEPVLPRFHPGVLPLTPRLRAVVTISDKFQIPGNLYRNVLIYIQKCILYHVNLEQFIRFLREQHKVQIVNKGGRHPKLAILGTRKAVVPTHGGRKQLGKGLMKSIMRDLGIKEAPPN